MTNGGERQGEDMFFQKRRSRRRVERIPSRKKEEFKCGVGIYAPGGKENRRFTLTDQGGAKSHSLENKKSTTWGAKPIKLEVHGVNDHERTRGSVLTKKVGGGKVGACNRIGGRGSWGERNQ